MRNLPKISAILLAAIMCLSAVISGAVTLDAQVSTSTEEIYPGVIATDYYLEEGG